jgi:hypothetical protein
VKHLENGTILLNLKTKSYFLTVPKCWDMAQNGEDKFDGINNLIGLAEKCMV